MSVIGVLQARTSSSRLFGKVLKPILGKAMILRQLERLESCKSLDKLVLATSEDSSDDELAKLVEQGGYIVYRGSLSNVLDRYYQVALMLKPDHIARLTGDCPLADSAVVDLVVQQHIDHQCDYTTNALKPTYPDGLDVEVMTFGALERAAKNARLPSELEHVTPYIHRQSDLFELHHVQQEQDLSDLRWTVDEPEDFDFVNQVYQALYPQNAKFDMQDILTLLKARPELQQINASFERNEGAKKTELEDQQFLESMKNV